MSRTLVGRSIDELETPVALVDLDVLERNIDDAHAYARAHGIALYPHAKTHKTLEIGRRLLAAGSTGLTVAKSGEAAIYADEGLGPLVLHYPIASAEKARRVLDADERVGLTLVADSLETIAPVADEAARRGRTLEVLVEIEVGMERTGAATPARALAVAQALERRPGVRVAGISCYPGHLRIYDDVAVAAGLQAVGAILDETRALFAGSSIDARRVSGGSTPTLFLAHLAGFTEMRPGTFVFRDRADTRDRLAHSDCALTYLTTVVSTATADRMVLDAGSKTLAEAPPAAGLTGHGAIPGRPGVDVWRLNEEHASCRLGPDEAGRFGIGDRVRVVPNHVCTSVNLHDWLYAVRNGIVVEEWRVAARGTVR